MDQKKEAIKKMIIERLELDISLEEFKDTTPLFEGGLELDSVESLEILVGLEKLFSIQIEDLENPEEDFRSVETIMQMVDRYLNDSNTN